MTRDFNVTEWLCVLGDFQTKVSQHIYEPMPYNEWRRLNLKKSYNTVYVNIIEQDIFIYYYQDCETISSYQCSKSSSFGQYLMNEYFNTEEKDMGLSEITGYDLSNCATTLSSSNTITATKYDSINSNTVTIDAGSITGWCNISDTIANKTDIDRLEQEIDKLKVEKIKNKEKEDKNMFDFDFGKVNSEAIRLSAYGIAVKNASNVWVSYDAKSEQIINVDILNFSGDSFLYKLPVAISQIKIGDTIVHARKPMFIVDFTEDHKAFIAIDIMAGEEKTIIPCKSPFGFDFITKIISIMDFGLAPDNTNPFGNMLPFILMGDNKDIDPMMMYFCMGANKQTINPIMLMLMSDKNSNKDDMIKMMMLSGAMNNGMFGT